MYFTTRSLGSEMGNMTPARFEEFKRFIRQNGTSFLRLSIPQLKRTSEWISFRQLVVENFPELQQYDDQWPVDAYFKIFKHNWQPPVRKVAKSQQPSTGRSSSNIVGPFSTPKRIRVFVGKTPPRHYARGKENVSDCNNSVLTVNYPRQILTGSPSLPMSLQTQAATSAYSCNTSPQMYTPATYPVSCLQCGHMPTITPAANREISNALQARGHIISALAGLGIMNDHHLHAFKKWGTLSFFDSVPLHVLGPLHRAVLFKYLRLFGCTEKENKEDLPEMLNPGELFFQLPSPNTEKHLTDPRTSVSALQEAMGLEDDVEAFNRIIKTIEETMNDALPSPEVCDTGEENELQWQTFTHKICLKSPLLKRYQNGWPIPIYIKWRRQQLCSQRLPSASQCEDGDPTNSMDNTHSLFQRRHIQGNKSPMRMPLSECLIHELPNVAEACSKLLQLLCSFGMQELLAVFLAIGIKSNEDFDLLCDLDVDERISMCENLAPFNLKLNPFQEMMLKKMICYMDMQH